MVFAFVVGGWLVLVLRWTGADVSAAEVIRSDDARVGISLTMTQATFRKLLKLSPTPDMEGWSKAIVKLIEGAP